MKKITKRYLSVLLTFALVLALPLAATQEANAASGSKINQPVQITTTYTNWWGDNSTDTTVFVYNKKGLATQAVDNYGNKTVYTYSKKGIVKTEQYFDKTGALTGERVNTIKGNKIRKSDNYTVKNGQKVLSSTTTYKYKKGKIAKETRVSADGTSTAIKTYKKGIIASYISLNTAENESSKTVFDKHGNKTSEAYTDAEGTGTYNYKNVYKKGKLVQRIATYTDEKGVVTPESTYAYSYTKKGKLKSVVEAYADSTSSRTTTTQYAYTKSGLVKGVVETIVEKDSEEGTTETRSYSQSISYKKVKVKSKFRKEVKKSLKKEFFEDYMPW